MRFLPREEKFYVLFSKQAELLSEAARILLEGMRKGNAHMAGAATELAVLENRGDEVIHEIFTRLNQTFITPMDPEDVHSVSSALDDVLDGLEDTAHRLVSYAIDQIPEDMVELAQIAASCCRELRGAVAALAVDGPILPHCIEINRLENEGDRIGRGAVAGLFMTERDPIAIIKLKEVYDFLEASIDSCEDVADVLQNVAVKNS